MKNKPIEFAGVTIEPGSAVTVELPVSKLYTHTEVKIPVHIIHGKSAGPSIFVSAAIHGDEINGTEIIRRLMKHKSLNRVKGTLYTVPIVNVFGFLGQSRYTPDRRDLNRMFPGDEKGSLAARIADLFTTNVVDKCDLGIDLHTGSNNRFNLPQIRACCDDITKETAMIFGAPVVINTNTLDKSLRAYAASKKIPMLLYEAGEALRFDEASIQMGIRGIISVLRYTGMLPPTKSSKVINKDILFIEKTSWIRANSSGIVSQQVAIGQAVSKGDTLAVVVDPFSEYESILSSPFEGVVIGNLNLPLVHEGEAMFHIGRTGQTENVDALLEETLTVEDFKLPGS
ncbi:MAG: succinylglutamate desuccinylase [Denitrovibrio sp.]|nr:MAG: succinylglutamate desuccinylase [Denitrovibrio sp.]